MRRSGMCFSGFAFDIIILIYREALHVHTYAKPFIAYFIPMQTLSHKCTYGVVPCNAVTYQGSMDFTSTLCKHWLEYPRRNTTSKVVKEDPLNHLSDHIIALHFFWRKDIKCLNWGVSSLLIANIYGGYLEQYFSSCVLSSGCCQKTRMKSWNVFLGIIHTYRQRCQEVQREDVE